MTRMVIGDSKILEQWAAWLPGKFWTMKFTHFKAKEVKNTAFQDRVNIYEDIEKLDQWAEMGK